MVHNINKVNTERRTTVSISKRMNGKFNRKIILKDRDGTRYVKFYQVYHMYFLQTCGHEEFIGRSHSRNHGNEDQSHGRNTVVIFYKVAATVAILEELAQLLLKSAFSHSSKRSNSFFR